MATKFSTFEAEVNYLLNANISTKDIITILNKPSKSIYNAISRVKKKKRLKNLLEIVKKAKVFKVTSRVKRAINRDLTRSPIKQNKELLAKNNLDIFVRSLQRLLKAEGYYHNVAKKKAILNEFKANTRLKYAKERVKELENIN